MNDRFVEFVPLLELYSAGDRAFLRSVLDAERIAYFIQGEHVAPYLFHAMPMRLMVRADHVDAARELLQHIELSALDLSPPGKSASG